MLWPPPPSPAPTVTGHPWSGHRPPLLPRRRPFLRWLQPASPACRWNPLWSPSGIPCYDRHPSLLGTPPVSRSAHRRGPPRIRAADLPCAQPRSDSPARDWTLAHTHSPPDLTWTAPAVVAENGSGGGLHDGGLVTRLTGRCSGHEQGTPATGRPERRRLYWDTEGIWGKKKKKGAGQVGPTQNLQKDP
jgi:hypothetical protein